MGQASVFQSNNRRLIYLIYSSVCRHAFLKNIFIDACNIWEIQFVGLRWI
uniref:Uncharacterized protein n=1 Tax=Anguilla anguilla TaxID=7936 RepID=A0A0E9SUT6_ANGAN